MLRIYFPLNYEDFSIWIIDIKNNVTFVNMVTNKIRKPLSDDILDINYNMVLPNVYLIYIGLLTKVINPNITIIPYTVVFL